MPLYVHKLISIQAVTLLLVRPLTTSVDTVAFSGSYNAVNGTGTTFTAGDSITGNGYGVGNSLNVTDTTGASAAGVPTGVTVSGVQNANITSTGTIGGSAVAAVAQTSYYTSATPASGTNSVTVGVGGNSFVVTNAASANAQATAIAAGLNALGLTATVGTVSSSAFTAASGGVSVRVVAPTAGTALPTITFTAASDATEIPVLNSGISGIANQAAVANAQYDVSGWTGLTNFNGTSIGGENVKAAATTSISATDSALGAGTINTVGGNDVTITATGSTATTGNSILVGTSTTSGVPAGAVSVTQNITTALATGATITTYGGSSVTVNQTAASNTTTNGNAITQNAVAVNGTANTTTVTVNQANTVATAVATSASAKSGVVYQAATTAAPGVQGNVVVNGTQYAVATVATPSVAQGVVTITDKNGTSQTAAGTISTVTLNGFGSGSSIVSNALTTLNVGGTTANGGATLTVTDNLLAHSGSNGTTLALNANALIAAATIDAVGTVTAGTKPTITDNTVKVLNLTNTGVSNFTFADTALTTATIGGSGTITLPLNTTNAAALTSLTVGGTVSFNDGGFSTVTGAVGSAGGLNTYGSALTIANTTTGAFTAVLDAANQSFNGTGNSKDTIVISTDALKSIVGSGSGADQLILNATGSNFTAAYTGRNVSGFEVLGLTANAASNTVNVDQAQLFGNTFTSIDVWDTSASANTNIVHATQNSSITLENSASTGALSSASSYDVVNVTYIDGSGATDNVTVNLAGATNHAVRAFGGIGLVDKNSAGVGTVNFVANNLTQTGSTSTGSADNLGYVLINKLLDANVSTLNVSGTADLGIGYIATAITAATSATLAGDATWNLATTDLTINNTLTGTQGLNIYTLADDALESITFTGTNKTVIANLDDADASGLVLTNSGTGAVQITAISSDTTAALDDLTLNGNIQLGATNGSALSLSSTTGITISGATDNSQVNLSLGAAASTAANTVTLGNGNNYLVDATSAGDVVYTLGTGANYVDVHNGGTNATFSALVTFAADTNTNADADLVYLSKNAGQATTATGPLTVITGAGANDLLKFTDTSLSATVVTLTAAEQASVAAAATSLAAALIVDGLLGAHQVAAYNWNGNTYVLQNGTSSTGSTSALNAASTWVELVGIHTLGAVDTTADTVTLLS